MKPPFVMSKYASIQDLLSDKAKYWEAVAKDALERLMDIEEVGHSEETNEYYWINSGEIVGN